MPSTTEITAAPKELDAGMMIRRGLFLLMLVFLTLYYLAYDFKGLSHPTGMEQAQIARQIARGERYVTKCIRPVALLQINKHLEKKEGSGKGVALDKVPETYQAPLNPMLNSMVLSVNKDLWKMGPKDFIYTPDILISGAAMVLLLSSIGVTYLLVSRIFDTRIGGVTAFLMLLCELLWRYSQSGLPQMLMLFLFSFTTYFLYKAVENTQQGKPVYLWIVLAGGFFSLLALSHWLCIWPFLGLLFFASFYYNPRGIQTFVLLGVFMILPLFWAFHNYDNTGDIMGTGKYAFFAGMGGASETAIFRDYSEKIGGLAFTGFWHKVISNFVAQFASLYGYLGSIVVAPLFFLSLLHPFRRKEIADFRWCLLAMWVMATLGMSLFGIKPFATANIDTNNLHILFIPLFSAYGLAFLAVLWNRLNLPMHHTLVRNGHFVLAVVISAIPFLFGMPLRIRMSVRQNDAAKCHWPHYIPKHISLLNDALTEKEVIVTDIPWATAWYADRVSIWLPMTKGQLSTLQDYAQEVQSEVVGLFLTPTSTGGSLEFDIVNGDYREWQDVILRLPVSQETGGLDIMQQDTEFSFKMPLALGYGHIFYTDNNRMMRFAQAARGEKPAAE